MFYFIHIKNTKNIGDKSCCPIHYFKFPEECCELDFNDDIPGLNRDDTIIFGGGAVEPHINKYFQDHSEINDLGIKTYAWGVGLSRRRGAKINAVNLPRRFSVDLYGSREFGREIGQQNMLYVPCPTCMHSIFEKKFNVTREVVFYSHSVFPLDVDGMTEDNVLFNRQKFEDAISFLASAEYVVTNSYHGTYWSLLLGKKTICLPFSSKFYGFIYPPAYCLDKNWKSCLNAAISYTGALADARRRNIDFWQEILLQYYYRRKSLSNLINISKIGLQRMTDEFFRPKFH